MIVPFEGLSADPPQHIHGDHVQYPYQKVIGREIRMALIVAQDFPEPAFELELGGIDSHLVLIVDFFRRGHLEKVVVPSKVLIV